ncbi:MAG: cysteine-rich CWC family protein [Bacillota bacterium]|nr:cysteine-rich CWC family protein [Bacillota bacterium]
MSDGIDRSRCPICGKPNGCAVEAGKDPYTCWCMTTKVPPELRAQTKGGACICKHCVESFQKREPK